MRKKKFYFSCSLFKLLRGTSVKPRYNYFALFYPPAFAVRFTDCIKKGSIMYLFIVLIIINEIFK